MTGRKRKTDSDAAAEPEDTREAAAEDGATEPVEAVETDAPADADRAEPGDTPEAEMPEEIAEDAETSELPAAPEGPTADDPEQAPVAATPTTMDEPRQDTGGPGFLPLMLGGLVAGAIGLGAGYLLWAPGQTAEDERIAELTGTLARQGETVAALGDRADALEAALAGIDMPDPVDLAPLESGIADLSTRLDTVDQALAGFQERIAALEARPVLTGDGATDEAAMAAAVEDLRRALNDQQDRNEALAEELRGIAEASEARIAEAEARAAAAAETAAAQATLSELRIAIAAGTPFAGPLADVAGAEGIELPEALAAVAETGIPTLEEIQTRFPAAARDGLSAALREGAQDGSAGDRLTAFIRSQIGGRSLEPQDGPGPDAVLSRVGAAVEVGDLDTALRELEALPAPAREVMSDWTALVSARSEALAALDSLTGTPGGN